ncbi:UDP-N-acetylmuramoyl-tripeptide--D-alanyl-D-alanine ligase [Ideonella paludis]|uniref:UDP-N-acetylmuramoyl-tripeptide--D-alanyl-D-alanine ligase n=1 Tax=Ideonella paludis TaxID=1233411 RepID=A0ABS5DWQ4_9BURK|nr:UDP-N-acetylmuramoyl-tripeptide--D-alanyl-D-alanine ligase [Ideonella paludis]MBQ0935575.1 UDP-N-acetylmuramoyl-tripeptide--D-alanyl-D-alanine ligase [Ideonella paludis]
MMTLAQAQRLILGATLVGDPEQRFSRVHTDTRSLQAGDLFVALRGERFDANDFLATAKTQGASAALAERGLADAGLPGLQVPDALQALQQLAKGWRGQHQLPVIAVTGSNGKTTVTQMVASILRAAVGEAALATVGNFNNHIGVPLTVLRLRPAHRLAVVELGMNHPGEIAELAAMAQPTVAIVNNAQREHQEFMHTVEAVAQENGSVLSALPADGVAVFPADDAYAPLWAGLAAGRRLMRFALQGDAEAEVQGQAQWTVDHWQVHMQTPQGSASFSLHIAGAHNVKNALAASAAALAAGVALADVVKGLEQFAPVTGRSQVKPLVRHGQALTLVDDTYNANPDSVRAAIQVLAALPAPRLLILGDMGEVGDQGPQFHAEVGAQAAAAGLEQVWCAGALMTHAAQACAGARHFADTATLLQALPELKPFASVLVKGSRFMKMEQVVAALQGTPPAQGAAHAA